MLLRFRLLALGLTGATWGCTGLVAGPETNAVTPVQAPRDSAYARTRRALAAESFTLDVVDSLAGHITGRRYNSPTARLGTAQICRVGIELDISGDDGGAKLATHSRWLAPAAMADQAPEICEEERAEVLDRIHLTVAPLTTP